MSASIWTCMFHCTARWISAEASRLNKYNWFQYMEVLNKNLSIINLRGILFSLLILFGIINELYYSECVSLFEVFLPQRCFQKSILVSDIRPTRNNTIHCRYALYQHSTSVSSKPWLLSVDVSMTIHPEYHLVMATRVCCLWVHLNIKNLNCAHMHMNTFCMCIAHDYYKDITNINKLTTNVSHNVWIYN